MKVVILGAGGLGSVIGGYLARASNNVALIGRAAHVQAIREHGLTISSGATSFTVPLQATDKPDSISSADYLLVTVKTRDTASALESVKHMHVKHVASLQNGVEKDDLLAAVYGRDKVIGATCIIGATLVAPGHAELTLDGEVYFGEFTGRRSPRLQELVAMFRESGLKTEIPSSILSAEWSKLCQITPAALLSALTRLEYHQLQMSPDLATLFVDITRETAAVARASRVEIADYPNFQVRQLTDGTYEEAVQRVIDRGTALLQRGMTHIVISMLQDLQSHRPTEIEAIAGYLVRKAEELGIYVPNTRFAYRAVKGIDYALHRS